MNSIFFTNNITISNPVIMNTDTVTKKTNTGSNSEGTTLFLVLPNESILYILFLTFERKT